MEHSLGQDAWLQRPLWPGAAIRRWQAIYFALIVFVVLTRLWRLESRAYCHDESIHAWESWKLLVGQGYIHSPTYHGPLLYHLTALIFAIFGHNDFTARLGTALGGILIVALPFWLRRQMGVKWLLAATLLMAISPILMHRARFIRHDQWAIVFNLVLMIAILRYYETRQERYLYLMAAALVLGMAGKETSFITYAIFGGFMAALLLFEWLGAEERSFKGLRRLPMFDLVVVMGTLLLPFASPFPILLLGGNPLDYTPEGLVFSLGITLIVFGLGAGIGLWWNPRRWLACAALFWGIFLPLYTTMFTNGLGVATGVVGQVGYWLSQHEVARGGQPWFYYIVLTVVYEFLPLILCLASMAYYLYRGFSSRRALAHDEMPQGAVQAFPLLPFIIFWAVAVFVLYSWAGEKMPWLMQHLSVPMHLLGGWGLSLLWEADWQAIRAKRGLWLLLLAPLLVYLLARLFSLRPSLGTSLVELSQTIAWASAALAAFGVIWGLVRLGARLGVRDTARMVALGLLLVLAVLTLRFAWMATFIQGDSAAELMVYAQGAPDVAIVARDLETISRRLTGGLHLKIAHDSETSWPFVWYLRNYDHVQFFGDAPSGPLDADVVLVGLENEAAVRPFLQGEYIRREYRLIWWPYQDWYMQMTPRSLWNDLRDPLRRRALWRVFFYREWEKPLTEWPYVKKFALYMRRDVLQALWETSPESVSTFAPAEEDVYLTRWTPLSAVLAWGQEGGDIGQLRNPKGIALDGEGNIYVADSQNHRIQVFDPEGRVIRQWGSQGSGPGQFLEPWGVAVSPDGLVYVADTWNHRIQVFDREGNFIRMWGISGETSQDLWRGEVFYGPRALAFDKDGNLYVADTGNKRILKYDATGKLVAVAGGAGDRMGQLQEPVGIAVAPDGSVYVADTWNRRIQVFDADLNILREWPVQAWEGTSVVNKPYLTYSPYGFLWVTDPEGHRVLGFTPQGELVMAFGRHGADLEGMNLPTGIVADAAGRLYVCDSGNHRVLVFAPPMTE